MKVKDCMCSKVYCIKPETTINEVAKIMSENHIGCTPVCENDGSICGIITDRDILLRVVACDKDSKQTKARDIMSTNLCTCMDNDDMVNAQKKMSNFQIRRLPVCDLNNHVIGILSLGDLANNNSQLGKEEVCTTLGGICNCNNYKNNF